MALIVIPAVADLNHGELVSVGDAVIVPGDLVLVQHPAMLPVNGGELAGHLVVAAVVVGRRRRVLVIGLPQVTGFA